MDVLYYTIVVEGGRITQEDVLIEESAINEFVRYEKFVSYGIKCKQFYYLYLSQRKM